MVSPFTASCCYCFLLLLQISPQNSAKDAYGRYRYRIVLIIEISLRWTAAVSRNKERKELPKACCQFVTWRKVLCLQNQCDKGHLSRCIASQFRQQTPPFETGIHTTIYLAGAGFESKPTRTLDICNLLFCVCDCIPMPTSYKDKFHKWWLGKSIASMTKRTDEWRNS